MHQLGICMCSLVFQSLFSNQLCVKEVFIEFLCSMWNVDLRREKVQIEATSCGGFWKRIIGANIAQPSRVRQIKRANSPNSTYFGMPKPLELFD